MSDRGLLAISTAAFLGTYVSAARPLAAWLGMALLSLTPAVTAGYQRAARGSSVSRTAMLSGLVAGLVGLLAVLAISVYLILGTGVAFAAHFFGRDIPWWMGVVFGVTQLALVIVTFSLAGHALNRMVARKGGASGD